MIALEEERLRYEVERTKQGQLAQEYVVRTRVAPMQSCLPKGIGPYQPVRRLALMICDWAAGRSPTIDAGSTLGSAR